MIGLALRMRPGLANAVCEAGHGDSGGVSQGDQDQGQRRPPWADGGGCARDTQTPSSHHAPLGRKDCAELGPGPWGDPGTMWGCRRWSSGVGAIEVRTGSPRASPGAPSQQEAGLWPETRPPTLSSPPISIRGAEIRPRGMYSQARHRLLWGNQNNSTSPLRGRKPPISQWGQLQQE